MPTAPAGIAFDAFGTLFDLGGLRPRLEPAAGERAGALLDAFTARLVPATWHATVAGHYRPFPEIAALCLESAARELRIAMSAGDARDAAAGLAELPIFADAGAALDGLSGTPLAVLSNGTAEGVRSLVGRAGLAGRFDHLLAADEVEIYKPSTRVYDLALRAFGAPAERVLLVSANEWDVAGAKLAGLRGAWIARGRPETAFLGIRADVVADELADLPAALRSVFG